MKTIGITLMVILFIFTPANLIGEERAMEIYKEAKMAIYRNDWPKAIDLLKTFEKDFPGSHYMDDSIYWLAYSLNKLSLYEDPDREVEVKKQALQYLNQLIETRKDSPWADDAKILRIKVSFQLVHGGAGEYLDNILKVVESRAGNETEIDLKVVALDALVQVDTERALPYLETILKETTNEELRSKVVFILNNSRDKRLRSLVRRTLLEKPRWIRKVEPVYPIEALRRLIAGQVTLEVVTDPEGNVIEAAVKKGHPLLRNAALQAVKQWKHEPTPVDGESISRVFTVTITFEIY